jgi:hypothetical protein
MTTHDDHPPPSLHVSRITITDGGVHVCLDDTRPTALELFSGLPTNQQHTLVEDIWTLGARVLGNAYSQAREAKLEEIGRRLLDDVERHVRTRFEAQDKAVSKALARFFDPRDGEVARRLTDFVADEGVLARFLREHLGAEDSMLATTLARSVGQDSEIFRKLDPEAREGVVRTLEARLAAVMDRSQQQLFHALDPMSEHGPVAKLLRSLQEELKAADEDRTAQLSKAIAALDANDESSPLSRLMRETQAAKEVLLESLNPQGPRSPLAAIRRAVEEMLDKHGQVQRTFFDEHEKRYRELANLVQEAVVRKQAEAQSPRGGATFEKAVVEFAERVTRGGQYIVETTGNTVGRRSRSKVGDAVISFAEESAFAGCRVVLEAKHDASYKLKDALEEAEAARENRGADVAVFVFAANHAPSGIEDFARYGDTIVVAWDPEDPSTDPILRAAIVAALAMARRKKSADQGELDALADVEKRIHAELSRLKQMRTEVERISKASDALRGHLGKAQEQFEKLVDDAKNTLRALNVELVDEKAEIGTPIFVPRLTQESIEIDRS